MSDSPTSRIRQRFSVIVGWVGVVVGLALFAGTISSSSSGALPGIGVAVASCSYCVMARPWLGTRADALIVSNVLREVTLPWGGISHASSRGSLAIHDNDGHRTTAWAIGSQKARSQSGDDSPGMSLQWRPSPENLVSVPTSAAALREAIDAEVIDNPPGPSGRSVRWLPLPCALMALAVLAPVAGMAR